MLQRLKVTNASYNIDLQYTYNTLIEEKIHFIEKIVASAEIISFL